MDYTFKLNTHLLKKIPNLTVAAKNVGLRPATVSNLTTGKIPIGRAEVKTLVALSKIADCTLDDLIIIEGEAEKIETGIKSIDLFAPLVRGGTAGLVARSGMGQLILLAEIFYRLKSLHYFTILFIPDDNIKGINDATANTDFYSSKVEEVYKKINNLNSNKEIIIGVDRSMLLSGDLNEFKQQIDDELEKIITFIIVDTTEQAVDDDSIYGPLESLWSFDMDLVTRKMFPAINPINSTSLLLESEYFDNNHLTIIRSAKKLLRRYRELIYIVNRFGENNLSKKDKINYHRGLRLEAFLTQPFYTSEYYTKTEGVWVNLQDAVDGVKAILGGKLDQVAATDLMYRSHL